MNEEYNNVNTDNTVETPQTTNTDQAQAGETTYTEYTQTDAAQNQSTASSDETDTIKVTDNAPASESQSGQPEFSQTDTTQTQGETGQTSQTQAEANQPQPDPYSKYNFYQNQQYYQGYQNPGYQAQGYTNNGYGTQAYQNPGYSYQAQQTGSQYGQASAPQGAAQYGQQNASQYTQQAGYNTTNPQYNGVYGQPNYQNNGYQNSQQGYNSYPAGSISYVNNVDSIYPGTAPHRSTAKKPKSKASKFFTGVAMSAAFGLVAAGVFVLVTYFYKQQNPDLFTTTTQQVQVTTSSNKNDSHLNLDPAEGTSVPSTSVIDGATFTGTDVSKVVEENMPAIVAIDCITQTTYWYGTTETPSAGSGIIVEKNDKELMIATNDHVVSGTKDIKVKFIDGTTAPAKIKGKDDVEDLAVLTIDLNDISQETLDAIAIAKIGNSDEIKVGEMAIAIGNALGYGQSVTVGYISGKDREVTIEKQKFTGLLQTDAAINPGNSGGALLNLKGEVIGINNAKITGSDVEGMGYAIPISKAFDILNDFISRETLSKEEQGYLGIQVLTVTEELSNMYNWPIGAYISAIDEGSAASKAGLMVGDVITELDGFSTKNSDTLVEKIQSTRAGATTTLTVKRRIDGEFQDIKIDVVLGNRPSDTGTSNEKKEDEKKPEGNTPEAKTPDTDVPDKKSEDLNPGGLMPDDSQPETSNPGRTYPGGDYFNGTNPGGFDPGQIPDDFDLSQIFPDGFDYSQLPDIFNGNGFPGSNNQGNGDNSGSNQE